MHQKFIILASFFGLLAGCVSTSTSAPTPLPPDYLPTVVALTGQAAIATSQALTPTATEIIAPTETPTPEVTPLPTITPTPEPAFGEFAQIRFLSPGPSSYVGSPIQLGMLLVAGESNLVNVEVLGEDGKLLTGLLERVTRNPLGLYRSFKLRYEIRGVSEAAWIIVSSKDEFGRMQALNTLQIFLISSGPSVVNEPGNIIYERAVLETPKDEDIITGGTLFIRGRFWPMNSQPVFLDLINEDGRPISTRVLTVTGIDPQSFETTIPYTVTEPTKVRLTVHQVDPGLNRDVYVYSQLLTLNP
jgi:hypothetical protein